MDQVVAIGTFVANAVMAAWPAFLTSVALGVLIRALKLDGAIRSALSARIGWSIVLATMIGAGSPFCSCTVVPVVSGLLLSGVPIAPVMAFWIASPTMDPEIFVLSIATLGWPIAVARLVATFGLSLGAGYFTWFVLRGAASTSDLLRARPVNANAPSIRLQRPAHSAVMTASGIVLPLELGFGSTLAVGTGAGCCAGSCSATFGSDQVRDRWWTTLVARLRDLPWQQLGSDMLTQTWSLGRWLLLAFVLEALIVQYVPQAAIAGLLGRNSVFAVPLAALIGVPLYLNNVSALPIVAGLLEQGMQPGAAIAFLIAGPVTTIPAMTAVWGIVQRRVFALYLGIGLIGAIMCGLLTNLVLAAL